MKETQTSKRGGGKSNFCHAHVHKREINTIQLEKKRRGDLRPIWWPYNVQGKTNHLNSAKKMKSERGVGVGGKGWGKALRNSVPKKKK